MGVTSRSTSLLQLKPQRRFIMKRDPIWLLLVGFLAITLLAGCASSSPNSLIQNNDHAGLKGWYRTEAATLRGRAEVMRQMAAEYRKQQIQSNTESLSILVQHCKNLVKQYTKAAEVAEALAKVHATRPLSSPGNTRPPEAFKLFSF